MSIRSVLTAMAQAMKPSKHGAGKVSQTKEASTNGSRTEAQRTQLNPQKSDTPLTRSATNKEGFKELFSRKARSGGRSAYNLSKMLAKGSVQAISLILKAGKSILNYIIKCFATGSPGAGPGHFNKDGSKPRRTDEAEQVVKEKNTPPVDPEEDKKKTGSANNGETKIEVNIQGSGGTDSKGAGVPPSPSDASLTNTEGDIDAIADRIKAFDADAEPPEPPSAQAQAELEQAQTDLDAVMKQLEGADQASQPAAKAVRAEIKPPKGSDPESKKELKATAQEMGQSVQALSQQLENQKSKPTATQKESIRGSQAGRLEPTAPPAFSDTEPTPLEGPKPRTQFTQHRRP